jgi:hypothetical protein
MSKKIIIGVIACFVLSIATVAVLFATSGILKDKRGSFLREFPPHPVMEGDTLNIKYNSYYIAGGTPHTVYLGNYQAPLHMLVVNLASLDTQHVSLRVKGIMDQKFWSVMVQVDSPNYYLTDGAVPIIFKGNVQTWKADRYLSDSIFFRDIMPINERSLAVKSLSGSDQENILGILRNDYPYQQFSDKVLEKQLDGVFCTDGMLHHNKERNELVYLYFYRNQFIVMDTTLHVKYKGNTLDTTTRATIKTATLQSGEEKSFTLSSPPFMVNKRSCVSGNWLFVNSNLLAKNENQLAFDRGDAIDVYDLISGKYTFSFYIYNDFGRRPMKAFKVYDNIMVVLYDHTIQKFDLVEQYFEP